MLSGHDKFEDAEDDMDADIVAQAEVMAGRLRPFVRTVFCMYRHYEEWLNEYPLVASDRVLEEMGYDEDLVPAFHPTEEIREGDGVVFGNGRFGAIIEIANVTDKIFFCRILLSALPPEQEREYWAYHSGCTDCQTHILNNGWYEYEVYDEVWSQATSVRGATMLCIPCLEKRLGRELTPADFDPNGPLNKPDPAANPLIVARRGENFAIVHKRTGQKRRKKR